MWGRVWPTDCVCCIWTVRPVLTYEAFIITAVSRLICMYQTQRWRTEQVWGAPGPVALYKNDSFIIAELTPLKWPQKMKDVKWPQKQTYNHNGSSCFLATALPFPLCIASWQNGFHWQHTQESCLFCIMTSDSHFFTVNRLIFSNICLEPLCSKDLGQWQSTHMLTAHRGWNIM